MNDDDDVNQEGKKCQALALPRFGSSHVFLTSIDKSVSPIAA